MARILVMKQNVDDTREVDWIAYFPNLESAFDYLGYLSNRYDSRLEFDNREDNLTAYFIYEGYRYCLSKIVK